MNDKVRILLVEDDEDDFVLISDYFNDVERFEHSLTWVKSYQEALQEIRRNHYDIYLIDYRLDVSNGIELIKEAVVNGTTTPMILLTGQGDMDIDMLAMEVGAADYLVKGAIDGQVLERSIRYAINRAAALKELNEKEQRYRILFEQSVDAIFLLDNHFRIIDVNSSMQEFFHTEKKEFLNMRFQDYLAHLEEFQDIKDKINLTGHVKSEEILMKGKNRELECEITLSPLIDDMGHIYGYQGILKDVSLKKRAEKELLMAEKLSMTGKIARSIAHEVRNPLTNLNLALEQLNDEVDHNDNIALYSEIIKRNASRIEQLISEMLNSSKPKQLQLRTVSINDIIKGAISLSEDRIRLSKMKLNVTFDENIPQLDLDAELLRNAFLNIIINAIEAMQPHTGHLQIISCIEPGISASLKKPENGKNTSGIKDLSHPGVNQNAVVKIIDNGEGMSKEDLESLFDPFYTRKKKGMGLGLTSVQNIVQSHKGWIDVESEPGKGTTFIVKIPVIKV